MPYQVFARKYRPQVFEDVVAQEHVTKTLQNAVKNDRVASGYLFCGPRGTGKTTTARILAKALNCVNGPTPNPCGTCAPCIEITAGSSLDVLEIDAASNTGVDDIRTLRENVRYLPTGGKKRIYIIDEVHRLSGAAFDALLKTLEEPPPHVIFVFATTEPLKVPETILSRTQRFDFKRVSVAELAEHVRKIAQIEQITIDEPALQLLARKADGSVRDALSLLDQVAAFAGSAIMQEHVVEALGLVGRQVLFDYIDAIAAKDSRRVLDISARILEAGIDVADFVQELLEHYRVLLVLTVDKGSSEQLHFTPEEIEAYSKQADNFAVGDVVRLMKAAADLNQDLKSGLDERLVLELGGVKMAQMESTVSFRQILERLDQGSLQGPSSGSDLFGQSKKKSDTALATALRAGGTGGWPEEPPVYSKSVNLAQVAAEWDSFLGLLRQKSQMLASQVAMAELRKVADNEISLVFGPTGSASKQVIERPENLRVITAALRDHLKANVRVTFRLENAGELPVSAVGLSHNSATQAAALIEQSPRLKRLLEKVDGEIIGTRKVNSNEPTTER
ncbi:MAG TPA: DNA polymerase III subunit gamma/tau [Candidatus Deferrimicrobium sp.]|nr:DNA polymerase III subunit gamma/tau [Candidatus Deferrimicrobium sp.]